MHTETVNCFQTVLSKAFVCQRKWIQHCLCAAEQPCSPATDIGTEPQHKASAPATMPGASSHEGGSAGHVRYMAPAGPTEDTSRDARALADDMMDTDMGVQDALHQAEPDQILSPTVPVPEQQAQSQRGLDADTTAASDNVGGRPMLASVSAVPCSAQPADGAPVRAAPSELQQAQVASTVSGVSEPAAAQAAAKPDAEEAALATAPSTAPTPTAVMPVFQLRDNETQAQRDALATAPLTASKPASAMHAPELRQDLLQAEPSAVPAKAHSHAAAAASGTQPHSSQQAVPCNAPQSQDGAKQTAAKAVHSSQQAGSSDAQRTQNGSHQTAAKAVHSTAEHSTAPGQEAKPTASHRRTSQQTASKSSRKAVDSSPVEGTRMSLRSHTQGPDQKRRKTDRPRADRSRRARASARAGAYATRYSQCIVSLTMFVKTLWFKQERSVLYSIRALVMQVLTTFVICKSWQPASCIVTRN